MISTNTYIKENSFYVYAYLRNCDSKTAKLGTPYYIGKGSGRRAWNKHKFKLPSKSNIIILKSNLTEQEAFEHEINLISTYGRKDIGTGILINCTNGGEGMSGYNHTEDTKKLLSEITKSDAMQSRIKDTKLQVTCPWCLHVGGNNGMISMHFDNCKLNPNYAETLIRCPYCDKIGTKGNMKRYHFDNCKQNSNTKES